MKSESNLWNKTRKKVEEKENSISMNLEMLSTLESLANKLSSVQQSKGILVDNNGNKLNGLAAIKAHHLAIKTKPISNGSSIKYSEK